MVAVDLFDTPDVRATTRRGAITLRCDDPEPADRAGEPGGPGGRAAPGRVGMPARGARSTCTRPSPRRRGWPAGRATRRRRWWPWIGSGTCGPPPTDWTPWPARSAATWRSSCTRRPPSAAAGASGSRQSRCRRRSTSSWSVRPVGLSTAEVYRHLTPPDRPRPIGPVLEALARGDDRRPGSAPVQPAPADRRGARPRTGAGARRPGEPRPVARRVT